MFTKDEFGIFTLSSNVKIAYRSAVSCVIRRVVRRIANMFASQTLNKEKQSPRGDSVFFYSIPDHSKDSSRVCSVAPQSLSELVIFFLAK